MGTNQRAHIVISEGEIADFVTSSRTGTLAMLVFVSAIGGEAAGFSRCGHDELPFWSVGHDRAARR
jgi:hypothetical protein